MSVQQRLARLEIEFDRFRIPHPRLLDIHGQIDVMREVARTARQEQQADPRREPMEHDFIPIIGPSGSGKSTAVKDYLERIVGHESLRKGQRPVLHVTLSAKATTRRLGADILERFEDPDYDEGDGQKLLRRAYNHMQLAGTEVLILDELQHLINNDTKRTTAWSVTETIKRMLIQGVCPMILIGTEEARPVLLTNKQMKSRSLEPMFLDPLDLQIPEEKKMFLDHVAGVDLKMAEHGIFEGPSGLLMGDIPACLYDVSQGVIGIVSKLVMLGAARAIKGGRENVTRDDLSHAVKRWAIPLQITDHNPFEHGVRSLKKEKAA